jgi:hypothetical protein
MASKECKRTLLVNVLVAGHGWNCSELAFNDV